MMRMEFFERCACVKIMWITPGWAGVELAPFLCQGLLKAVGISWAFGLIGEGECLAVLLADAVPRCWLFFNSGMSLYFPHLLTSHLPALRSIPVLQRGCKSSKPHMNFPFSISTPCSFVSTSCQWAFVAIFSLEWHREGHPGEGNRNIAQQM